MSGAVWFHGGRVVRPEGVMDPGWVRVEGGRVCETGGGPLPAEASGAEVVDLEGGWLVPGFIDLHVHGGDGADVMDGRARSIHTIARFHASHGTTAWLPTTLTAPYERLEAAVRAVAEAMSDEREAAAGARVLGVHLEGPYLSRERVGAQNPQFVRPPDPSEYERLLDLVPGLVKKMTMAPELPGARRLMACLWARGAIPSLGHTDASFDQMAQALDAGHCHGTHLFNGMRGFHHRDPGAAGALLLSADSVCELIADGVHVHDAAMRLAVRLLGPDRVCLITDAMAAAGRPDGRYQLGGLEVTVEDGVAYLTHGHNLAGSTLTMDRAFANTMRRIGVTAPEAVRMTSTTPARELGLAGQKGDIAPGFDADLVWLDEALSVRGTWVGGRRVHG
ncbi:N-acetylglucosamine-6-phosphate deacetylase [Alicyclobacillus sp.]|uniref:N-acetylglucosamine-6-phosphate deacetylase n=1 Tax=Alicyclobacillus sp. TaxID=61169 RepID=UPI0025BB3AC8|nr:N-acetylglucosamine-6-phosphate deacetylase [Alicyclobacillus sp.]MCL6516477.1 N-acetylglucosamine-6-phosphate deacetylase [Alicyclobacillus sp.]